MPNDERPAHGTAASMLGAPIRDAADIDGPHAHVHAVMSEASAAMGTLMQLMPALLTKEFGLSRPRIFALGVLRAEPLPQRDLADATMSSPSACSRLVDQLEEDGLVQRLPSPEDRRTTLVGLTEAGRELLAAMQRRQDALLDEVIDELGPAAVLEGAQAITRMAARLAAVTHRELGD